MSKAVSVEMQERALTALSRNGAFKFTPTFFPYTSGQIGPYYIQSGDVMKDGNDFSEATKDMVDAVRGLYPDGFPEGLVIAGGYTRDWIFSNSVGAILGRPTVMIYKDGKTVGASMKGREVLPIADLNNEGSSPRDLWLPAINGNGGRANKILFYVDRMEEGVEVMKKLGLDSYAIAPLDSHAWDFLLKLVGSGVTPEIYGQLMSRMADRDGWARNMLRSESGLETLACLLASGKTRDKGLKIIDIGYPDLKVELVERLSRSRWPGVTRGI